MFRLAIAFTGDENSAKDVVQDAVIKLWQTKDKLAHIDNLKAWSLRITRNLCIDRKRKIKVIPNELDTALGVHNSDPTPEKHTIIGDQMSVLNRAMAQLNEKQKTAMILREVEGYTYQEVADEMDENINQVKILIYRGRQKLKDFIQNENRYGLIG